MYRVWNSAFAMIKEYFVQSLKCINIECCFSIYYTNRVCQLNINCLLAHALQKKIFNLILFNNL